MLYFASSQKKNKIIFQELMDVHDRHSKLKGVKVNWHLLVVNQICHEDLEQHYKMAGTLQRCANCAIGIVSSHND